MIRVINKVVVHCSATHPDMDIGAAQIRQWHIHRGWSDIGYHVVIRRSGFVEMGRPIEMVGAHTKGHNQDSVGVCLVGGINDNGDPDSNFTLEQLIALKGCINAYREKFGNIAVHGHRDFSDKACPSFDVQALISNNSSGF